jgi:ATP-binding cassette subfamily F protein 3
VLLRLDDVGRSIAARTRFTGVSFEARAGDRIGIVGPNGAGKTTLLRIAAGLDPADSGRVHTPRNVHVSMLRQEIDPRLPHSVSEEASTVFAHLDALEEEMRALEQEIASSGDAIDPDLADRYDVATVRFAHADGFTREARVAAVLEGLGFDDAARARPLSSFSGGWLMRVELAKLLLAEPDVLLLDEPTNHLDLPAIQWFESVLEDFRGALVVVSHDRTFLRKHASRIVELDGRGGFTLYEEGYDRYLESRELRHEELLARKASQDREIAHMEKFVERFRAKASKAKQAQSRVKALDKIERIQIGNPGARGPRLRIPDPPRSGRVVLRLEGIAKNYGDNIVYQGLDFQLERGERVALVGPNGAGKSTLLRIAAGELAIDAGEHAFGHNVEVGFFAQHQREALDEKRTVLGEIEASCQHDDIPRLRGHLGAFLFSGDDVKKRVGVLSGGEKARLALAKMLLRPSNLLVLDEPTNHLDVTACEILERALAAFEGTLLFVSHDRSFINALATRLVEVSVGGGVRSFLGDYDDYQRKVEEERQASNGAGRAARELGSGDTRARAKAARMADRERRKALDRARRRFERAEGEIQQLEEQLEALNQQLADPEIYADGARFRAVEQERQALRVRADASYSDWEALAAEIESLEASPDGSPD